MTLFLSKRLIICKLEKGACRMLRNPVYRLLRKMVGIIHIHGADVRLV